MGRQGVENLTTRELFDGFLPAVLDQHRDAAASMRGSACIIVHGEGAWVLRFDRSSARVEEGIDLDADLVVTFSAASFAALLRGEVLDPDAADPVCLGDASLLERIGRLMLAPARGALAA